VRGTNESGHLDFRKIMNRKYTRASLFLDIKQILLWLESSQQPLDFIFNDKTPMKQNKQLDF
tara:strand:+ start:1792 stop:1977 length:186 start_codon:yes stop_codon:yes gene_type:complete